MYEILSINNGFIVKGLVVTGLVYKKSMSDVLSFIKNNENGRNAKRKKLLNKTVKVNKFNKS